jgi:hypothetical protein
MLSLKAGIASILTGPLAAFGAAMNPPILIPVVGGYAQDVVERPCVSLIRMKGTPTFYVGEEAGPYDYPGGTSLTPTNLTEIIWEEHITVYLETVDSLTLLDNLYAVIIQTIVGQLSNLAAAGWANVTFEAGEETMMPVETAQGKRSRFYYGQPILVTGMILVHPTDPLIAPEPYLPISEIDLTAQPELETLSGVIPASSVPIETVVT